jgi:hypothetical protein
MKRLVIILVMIAITSTYSQFIKSYGLKVGGTISQQNWSVILFGDATKDNRLGMNIGVFAEFINNPIFSIATEINYTQKGFKSFYIIYDDPYSTLASWNQRIDYLNVSILAKSKVDLGIVKPYFFIGPSIDHEINKTSSNNNIGVYYDNFEKNIVGFKVGIGSELEIFQIKLLGEFLYDYSFGDIYKKQNVEVKATSYDFRIGIIL